MYNLDRHLLTGQLNAGLAADYASVAVLRRAVVFAGVALIALPTFGKLFNKQRAVGQHTRPRPDRDGHAVPFPCD